jgi:two-component system, cell cycle sensor histidine kinase and response regulator CckA
MKRPLRVLQIEDSEGAAELVLRALRKGGYDARLKRAEDAPAMQAALGADEWDVITADYNLPNFSAPAALKILQETGQDIPFIVVSGTIGEDLAVEMMRSGANDYVMKDNLSRLVPAIEREIREAIERKKLRLAQEQAQVSEERLALAIRATQLGTFDYYPRTGTLILSDFAKRHFGLSPDAAVATGTFLGALHPDDRDRVERTIANAFRPAGSGSDATEFRTIGIEDGIERWLSGRGQVFFDNDGQPLRLVGVMVDITEHKTLENQFRHQQKLESVGQLAGGVAHDFNNLLTVINGYAQLILSRLEPTDVLRAPIEQIAAAGDRAADLTRQLLMFSRKQRVEPKKVQLSDVVRDLREILRRVIGEDVELILCLEPGAALVYADPGQLGQVILNLAVNARDAMPKGGRLAIETRCFAVDESFARTHATAVPGEHVMLSVSDTGVGMPAAVKAHLFEPFFTTKEPGKGTGLGLSTVYGIVKQSGGSIWVNSEPGQGTTFDMLFPVAAGVADQPTQTPADDSPSGDETVLVAEDDAQIRSFVRQVLQDHGYMVLEASNGSEALGIARRHAGPIHLLVTDLVMPKMSGAALAADFTAARPGAPVLLMSGYTGRSGEPEPNLPFLQKPFSADQLLVEVRRLLGTNDSTARAPGD